MKSLEELLSTDTDIAAFVKLYERVGIDVTGMITLHSNGEYLLLLEEGDYFGGYNFFCSAITFDGEGKFLVQRFVE